MTASQGSAALFSRLIAFLLPLLLAAYWPLYGTGLAVHAGVIGIRLALMGGVALLALLWVSGTVSPAEWRWTRILGAYLGVLLLASLAGSNVSRGIHNWLRVVPVYCLAVALARPLRHKGTEKAFGVALGVAGIVSFLFIAGIYLHYVGLSLTNYERIRELKAQVSRSTGIALNPLASATLLFCVLSLCLLQSGLAHWLVTAAIAVLSSLFTGSRAPLALACAAFAAVFLNRLLQSRELAARGAAYGAICVAVIGVILGLVLVNPLRLSAVTEGRYDVWTVGMDKFFERPLTGHGAGSWQDDLVERLPGYYGGTSGLGTLRAGGYHSEFVTLLAEGGLLCFIPAMLVFGALYRNCCRIAFHRSTPESKGQALIFAFFLILLRAFVEVPGLFGYGEDVTDYIAAIFVAIVISRTSLLKGPALLPAPAEVASYDHPIFPGAVAEA